MLKKYVSKNEADKISLCKNKSFPQSRGKGEREGGVKREEGVEGRERKRGEESETYTERQN